MSELSYPFSRLNTLNFDEVKILFGDNLVSYACPQLEGFNLRVNPPWSVINQNEVLNLQIRSAGVLVIVREPLGILLVNVHDKQMETRWEIPSGKVNPEDSDVFATAMRECMEETGIALTRNDLIPLTYTWQWGKTTVGIHFVTVIDIILPIETVRDSKSRYLFHPLQGAQTSEIKQLAIENIETFMSQYESLVHMSKNAWMYSRIRAALERKLALLK